MKDLQDDKEKMSAMKKKYEEIEMSKKQLEDMRRSIEAAKWQKRRERRKRLLKNTAAAAAAVAIFILLPNTSESVAHAMSQIPIVGKLVEVVTFRDYQYESERNTADVTVPELVAGEIAAGNTGTESIGKEGSSKEETLKKTTEEINAEIRQITDELTQEFEKNLAAEWGYQEIMVKPEIIVTTEEYFTLKLSCYQGAGSGYQWNYFYTIDLNTGERLALKDLFKEGADYKTPISENIKVQMRQQMAADENIAYWLDKEDIPEWNFESITDETSFYVNEKGNIVISFNEGDVAPMYMGVVEFVIPDEAVAEIRK